MDKLYYRAPDLLSMKKLFYQAPELQSINIAIEQGFAGSVPGSSESTRDEEW